MEHIDQQQLLKPGPDSFNTKEASVNAWVQKLPLGDTGEALKQIYQALHEVNTLNIPIKERFEFMEAVAQPLADTLPELDRFFIDKPYPLPRKLATVARLSSELNNHMIRGYLLVLAQESRAGWLKKRAYSHLWSIAVHRVFYFFAAIIRNHQLLNLAYPKGLWQKVHHLYIQTEQRGHLKAKALRNKNDQERTRVEDEYKNILLTSLLPYLRLRGQQIKEIQNTMSHWTGFLELQQRPQERSGRAGFVVDLQSDEPPLPDARIKTIKPESQLLLNTKRLEEELQDYMRMHRSASGIIRLVDDREISYSSLHSLIDAWCSPLDRQEFRHHHEGEIELLVGMQHVFEGVKSGRPPKLLLDMLATDPKLSADIEEIKALGLDLQELGDAEQYLPEISLVDERFVDVDDSDLLEQVASTQNKQAPLNLGAKHSERWDSFFEESLQDYHNTPDHSFIGSVLDFSSKGYRLSLPRKKVSQIRIGEVLGLRDKGLTSWKSALVCWVREESDTHLQVGVKVIQNAIIPVIIRVEQEDEQSGPLPSLLGDSDNELTITLPFLSSLHHHTLLIEYLGEEAYFGISRLTDKSALYETYVFDEKEAVKDRLMKTEHAKELEENLDPWQGLLD